MGLFSKAKKDPEKEEDDYDYDREYEVEDNHSLPLDRAGITQSQYRLLFRLNIAAAVVQLASCLAIFFLTDADNGFNFYTNYPKAVVNGQRPGQVDPDAQVAFNISVGWLSFAFLALSSFDHLLVCTCFKGVYERGLSRNYNVFRWVEYSFSASIMRIIVGILSGVTDLHMQFLQFGLTACTMLFGLIFELENQKKRLVAPREIRWYLYWLGFIPHTFSWVVNIGYFFYSLRNGDPPGFVYAIIFIVFFLDLTFPIILGLQWKATCCLRSYVNGEIAFIILSFTSKNLLAWINFIGGNR